MRLSLTALPGISCFLIAAAGSPAAFVNNPSLLNTNDALSWSQLGSPGSSVAPTLTATSSNGLLILGGFSGTTAGGTVAKVCPATDCNWESAPHFSAGDFLLWSEDTTGNGTGPLNITFTTPIRGVGFYMQLAAPGTFTVSFTDTAGVNSGNECPVSDSNGNPLFVGVLDPTADITRISVTISSCAPGSPGGCMPSDFAVNSLYLTTAAPEPTTFVLICGSLSLMGFRRSSRWLQRAQAAKRAGNMSVVLFPANQALQRIALLGLACGAAIITADVPIWAQEPLPVGVHPATGVSRGLSNAAAAATVASPDVASALPVWRYQIASPVNGSTYSGYMVGTNPFNRGARTITIPVVLVPFIVSFTNTTTGFTTTFDPTAAPDAGCTADQTAISLVEDSPIFQSRDWILNGVDVGATQYIDAFQRANFWQYVQNTGSAYHTLLSYTRGEPLTLSLSYPAPTLAAEIRTGARGPCTNPTGTGSTNGSGYQGIVDFNVLHNAMVSYIATHSITPSQFPVFILYNVMYSQNGLIYLGGYHFSEAVYPQVLTSPGQTFAMANFRTNGTGPLDVSILSHEIAEWMDDPGGFNAVPPWGNIGEVTGCRRDLEVGDPLTQTDLPIIASPNGFAYHLQEMAFFSWFFRTPPIGVNALFSDNGTLTFDAGAVCQ